MREGPNPCGLPSHRTLPDAGGEASEGTGFLLGTQRAGAVHISTSREDSAGHRAWGTVAVSNGCALAISHSPLLHSHWLIPVPHKICKDPSSRPLNPLLRKCSLSL